MKGSGYTLAFALVAGSLSALLLTGVGLATRPLREANARAEEVRNVLAVMGAEYPEGASADDLLELFEGLARMEERAGRTVYVYDPADRPGRVVVPFQGSGLWGPIRGFLALSPDLGTVKAVSFYEQQETPGLGGEIASEGFRRRFEGRSARGPDGRPGLAITAPGAATGPNEIDGISGATMTCDKVENMLNETLRAILGGGEER